jgi:hypothetical protein
VVSMLVGVRRADPCVAPTSTLWWVQMGRHRQSKPRPHHKHAIFISSVAQLAEHLQAAFDEVTQHSTCFQYRDEAGRTMKDGLPGLTMIRHDRPTSSSKY